MILHNAKVLSRFRIQTIFDSHRYLFGQHSQKPAEPATEQQKKSAIETTITKTLKSSMFLQSNINFVVNTGTISLYDILRDLRRCNRQHIQWLQRIIVDLRMAPPLIPFQNWTSLISKPFLITSNSRYLIGQYTKNVELEIDDGLRTFNEKDVEEPALRKLLTDIRNNLNPYSNRLLESPHAGVLEMNLSTIVDRVTIIIKKETGDKNQ